MTISEISSYDEPSDTIHQLIRSCCNWSFISSHFKMLNRFAFDSTTNNSDCGGGVLYNLRSNYDDLCRLFNGNWKLFTWCSDDCIRYHWMLSNNHNCLMWERGDFKTAVIRYSSTTSGRRINFHNLILKCN